MEGVPSALIARNASWVGKQASALARRLPSNVEKDDLTQAGLIAVAQAALSFKWEGDAESEAGKEAFVRYARLRVKGAMIDELRQMDHLSRSQRRKIKLIEIARQRWRATHDSNPTLSELSVLSGVDAFELSLLSQDVCVPEQSTSHDEVEVNVDTAILLHQLAEILSERDCQVIDAYTGVGMTPTELADELNTSASYVSHLYKALCARIASHFEPERAEPEFQQISEPLKVDSYTRWA